MVEWTLISDALGEILVDSGSTCQDARIVREKDYAILNMKKRATRKYSGSTDLGFYSHRCIFREGFLYLAICSKHYPQKLSSHYLEEVVNDFEKICKNANAICLQNFGSAIQKKQRLYTSFQVQVNYWSLIIRCCDAARLVEICDDEVQLDEKYKKEAVSFLLQQTETTQHKSVVIGSYCAHYMAEGGIGYITMCGKSYPIQLACDFLKMLRSEFDAQFGTQVRHAKIGSFFSSFVTCMRRTVSMYWDTKAERSADLDACEANGKSIEFDHLNEVGVRTMQEQVDGLDKDTHVIDNDILHSDPNVAMLPVPKRLYHRSTLADVDETSSPVKMADGDVQVVFELAYTKSTWLPVRYSLNAI